MQTASVYNLPSPPLHVRNTTAHYEILKSTTVSALLVLLELSKLSYETFKPIVLQIIIHYVN